MKPKELKLIAQIFPKSTFEAHDGLYIYDQKGRLLCVYLHNGFSVSMDHPLSDEIKNRLENHGYSAWWKEIMDQATFEKIMDSIE